MSFLRQNTASLHRQIEARLSLSGLNRLPLYETLLRAFYGFYRGVERPLLDRLGALLPDGAERRKTPWLREDLLARGSSPAAIEQLPRCPALSCASLGEGMGAQYVFEGSTLGGAIIADHLKKNFDIRPDNGGRFFANYGEQRSAMWKRFVDALSSFATSEAIQADVLKGATTAFTEFDAWLERSL